MFCSEWVFLTALISLSVASLPCTSYSLACFDCDTLSAVCEAQALQTESPQVTGR